MRSDLLELPWNDLLGLRPKAWLCVGEGYSREEIKERLQERGGAWIGDAVTSLPDLARKALGGLDSEKILGALARQEILRMLLSNARIRAAAKGMPELKELRRQSGFYRKLDHAIQAGRMAFAHETEESVYYARLSEKAALRPLQNEVRALALAYEAWLRAKGYTDEPMLLFDASRALLEGVRPAGRTGIWPETIYFLANAPSESREQGFFEALSRHARCVRVDVPGSSEPRRLEWSRWHTLDDAVEGLIDRLEGASLGESAVVIPDQPVVRRSLSRSLSERGIPLADPRDPTLLRMDEGVKWALLPLSAVARDFERTLAVSYLKSLLPAPPMHELAVWIQEIHHRGIRQGLRSYSGGTLALAHEKLSALQDRFGGKRTCEEIGSAHLAYLYEQIAHDPSRDWLASFFEKLWEDFERDVALLEISEKKAPLLFWLERLRARLQDSKPPASLLKPIGGLPLYRLSQAPIREFRSIYFLGFPPDWFEEDEKGDYWFTERERVLLGAEFALRSSSRLRETRLAQVRSWIGSANEALFFDALYDETGRERDHLIPALRDLTVSREAAPDPPDPIDHGAHERWLASFGASRPLPPQTVTLPAAAGARAEITATALDHYSRCPFLALTYDRWKLRDLREPDGELWSEVRGNILHQAVKHLLTSRREDGSTLITKEAALDRAWAEKPPRGLLRSKRVVSYVKSRLLVELGAFCEKEAEYFARSKAHPISLDDRSLRLEFADVSIVGTPDRIDENSKGLFIMDYKSSSALPTGKEMLGEGYRLQLPFYALAAARETGKPVAGVQFIELNREAYRGKGIFLKHANGKEEGNFTAVTARSASLVAADPADVWSELTERVHEKARAYLNGAFHPKPSRSDPLKECSRCQVADLCGFRRKMSESEPEPEND